MNLIFDLNNQDYDMAIQNSIGFEAKPPKLNEKEKILHEKALLKAKKFKQSHAELLEIVMEVNQARLYEKFSLTSTFAYCMKILGLSKDVTCTLTAIARVSEQVPEIKTAIDEGSLCISNARRIAPIVTKENKEVWLERAIDLPQIKLEKEIAKVFPKEAVKEKAKYIAEDRLKLETGLDEETFALLKWAQDFVSQKTKSSANIEATLKEVLTEYKEKNDPIKRAERAENRKSKREQVVTDQLRVLRRERMRQIESNEQTIRSSRTRAPIPANVIHQVNLRDKGKCQFIMPAGTICGDTRWIQCHHIIEVQHGGANTVENLITLCSQHHRQHHKSHST